MPTETRTYRRSELYEQAWAEPVAKVARKYGVSGVALAKTCRKLGVPLPGVGHWARVQAGHETLRPPLPALTSGAPEELTVALPPRDAGPELSPEARAAIAALLEPSASIIVPDRLTNPHVLVAETRRLDSGEKPARGAALRRLDLVVSEAAYGRALRIVDSLLKALEARGLPVEVTEPREGPTGYAPRRTRVCILGQWVSFRLFERSRGLALQIIDPSGFESGRCEWLDGTRLRLEDRLNAFIAALYERAERMKDREARFAQARRESEEAERQRKEAQRRAEEHQRRATEFEDMIRRWKLANDIRGFCKQIRAMADESGCTIKKNGWVDEMLTFSETHVANIDPLTPMAKEIAGHVAAYKAARATKRKADKRTDPE